MFTGMFNDMPLRSIKLLAGDSMTPGMTDGVLKALNGLVLKGLLMMRKK